MKLSRLRKECTKLLSLILNKPDRAHCFNLRHPKGLVDCPYTFQCFYFLYTVKTNTNKRDGEQKHITKKLVGFHDQIVLLTTVQIIFLTNPSWFAVFPFRGYQLHNPFYTIWATKTGTQLAVSFLTKQTFWNWDGFICRHFDLLQLVLLYPYWFRCLKLEFHKTSRTLLL